MPTPSDRFPLSALLGRTQSRFVAECERRIADAGYDDLRIAHGANVLRHLPPGRPVSTAVLVRLSGVSKQAVSQQLAHLAERGYVTVSPGADARSKEVTITERGRASKEVVQGAFVAVEREWQRRYGADTVRSLRRALEAMTDEDEI